MDEEKEALEKSLRFAFHDILKGYSRVEITPDNSSTLFNPRKKTIIAFAKHFNFLDQIELDFIYDEAYNKARDSGLPTKSESLASLNESGDWTKKEESDLVQQKSYVETLRKTAAKIMVKSQSESIYEQVDNINKEISEQEKKRSSLIAQTCETYATSVLNSKTIVGSLYDSPELNKLLISEEDIEYIDNSDIGLLVKSFNSSVDHLSIDVIKNMALSGFFTSYFALVEKNPISIFRVKSACDLTFYQLNLLSYAKVLRSIIRNTQVPKHLLDDPDKILEWSEKGEKQRKVMEKASQEEKSFSMVGASKEDYEEMGAQREGVSIFDMAKKKGKNGGGLDLMDFVSE